MDLSLAVSIFGLMVGVALVLTYILRYVDRKSEFMFLKSEIKRSDRGSRTRRHWRRRYIKPLREFIFFI